MLGWGRRDKDKVDKGGGMEKIRTEGTGDGEGMKGTSRKGLLRPQWAAAQEIKGDHSKSGGYLGKEWHGRDGNGPCIERDSKETRG